MPAPQTELTDIAAIERLLNPEIDRGEKLVVREPSLIRVSGCAATARHYVLEYDLARARLADLRYAAWRFAKEADGAWRAVEVSEVAAGDARGPEFLGDGLDRDFAALDVCCDYTGAVANALDAEAIRATLAAYGLAADAGDADLVGALYTADTVVDIVGDRTYHGRESMAEMIRGDFHRSLLPWAGHTMGPALVSVSGDRAVSLHVARTYGPPPRSVTDLSRWNRRPFRYSVNRWELLRGDGGRWQVAGRRSCPAPGPDWRGLLAEGVSEWRAATAHFGQAKPQSAELDAFLDSRRALDAVTAASFALTADAHTRAWPLADGARIEIGEHPGPRTVGMLPTPGVVRVDGGSAAVTNVVVSYVDDGSGRICPSRLDRCRWILVRDDRSWVVRGVHGRPAGQ
ncbi:nuclear transport factor 2 family protein [Mycobacterium paraffinicum]|uniref:nuclear transport factor 2 family protein n=1 Tax=Mycobacterium paraffinicum TaxID=53378 RepID=UPI001ABEFE3C|nr:nuclear transport factor 2 family protein [Mycobacterium paraffinicum]